MYLKLSFFFSDGIDVIFISDFNEDSILFEIWEGVIPLDEVPILSKHPEELIPYFLT